MKKGMAFLFNKHESPKDALCTVWLKLAEWFWIRRFLNFINVFLLFHYYLPLEKGGALHLKKLESSSSKNALCQVWLKLACDSGEDFLKFVNVFLLFLNLLPLEKTWTNMNPLHPIMLCAKFVWNWPCGSGEEG